jgi:molybdopterin-guanine dinucleotide biosynthesis adapter protein
MKLSFPIIQVVGYKNSGKTTLACELIEAATKKGAKVASCKHHGHGGKPAQVEQTDSARHWQAGAIVSGVEGDGVLQLAIQQENWTLEKILAFYSLIDIDLLVLEGFKNESYPKIVLLRDEQDLPLLENLQNIVAVIAPFELHMEEQFAFFPRQRQDLVVQWFLKQYC